MTFNLRHPFVMIAARRGLAGLLAASLGAGFAQAAVTAEEARQLGGNLTAFGATKAGNSEGTIPAYDGGLAATTHPPGFKKDSGFWADPYSEDKPLFSITAKNVDSHAAKLMEGDLELLKRYPSFRMDVYPTRRSAAYPGYYLANTQKNALRCHTEHDGMALRGCFGGRPFPLIRTGYEAMWNLILHIQSPTLVASTSSWYVDGSGRKLNTSAMYTLQDFPYHHVDGAPETFEEKHQQVYARSLSFMEGPPRLLGEAIFTRVFTNPIDNTDEYWVYQSGQRRARLMPENAYDFPVATLGGAAFYDERVVFAGPMDRFEFRLLGKTEKYIPYNTYRLESAPPEIVLQDHFVNPDLVRWELHRVWVVEATLKPGYRHVYTRRRYYIDEDEPGAATTIAWNRYGQMHRMVHAGMTQHYDVQIPYAFQFWTYDFLSGVYATILFPGGRKGVSHEFQPRRDTTFSPEAMPRFGGR